MIRQEYTYIYTTIEPKTKVPTPIQYTPCDIDTIFDLQIQWLQIIGDITGAVATTREMSLQVTRIIREHTLQPTSDAAAAVCDNTGSSLSISAPPDCKTSYHRATTMVRTSTRRVISPEIEEDGEEKGDDDEEEEDVLGVDYEASVWAQVKLAALTLQQSAAQAAKRRGGDGGKTARGTRQRKKSARKVGGVSARRVNITYHCICHVCLDDEEVIPRSC